MLTYGKLKRSSSNLVEYATLCRLREFRHTFSCIWGTLILNGFHKRSNRLNDHMESEESALD
jgi:hypothetical protein